MSGVRLAQVVQSPLAHDEVAVFATPSDFSGHFKTARGNDVEVSRHEKVCR